MHVLCGCHALRHDVTVLVGVVAVADACSLGRTRTGAVVCGWLFMVRLVANDLSVVNAVTVAAVVSVCGVVGMW